MFTKWIGWLRSTGQKWRWSSHALTRWSSLNISQRKTLGLWMIVPFVALFYVTDDGGFYFDVLRYLFLLLLTIGFLIYFYALTAESAQAKAQSLSAIPPTNRTLIQRYWPLLALLLIVIAMVFRMAWTDWVNPQSARDKNDFIRTFFTVLGGSAIAMQLWFVYQNMQVARATHALSETTHRNDAFAKAIEQLGSEHHHVRIGALYALQRISLESEETCRQIMNTISSFVRVAAVDIRGAHQWGLADGFGDIAAEEIRIALSILGQRKWTAPDDGKRMLVFNYLDLRGVSLTECNFDGASFDHSILASARISNSTLRDASFSSCDMTRIEFESCDLEDAWMVRSLLGSSSFSAGFPSERGKRPMNLEGAYFNHAILADARFVSTSLAGVWGLTQEQVNSMRSLSGVPLPEGLIYHSDLNDVPF